MDFNIRLHIVRSQKMCMTDVFFTERKKNMKKTIKGYFTKGEILLWSVSVFLIVVSYMLCKNADVMTLSASIIGVTSLIFNAKGNPIGQILMIVFSVFYGIISYSFAYYGEMITYLGMTLPMAVFSLVSWLKNPYLGDKSVVEVNKLEKKELCFSVLLSAAVTAVFYFVLRGLGTSNLGISTVSVTTSFAAAYLTFRRSAYYALLYGANDVVLIIMWVMASMYDTSYVSVVVCFAVFLVNDLYGFVNWQKMEKNQKREKEGKKA